MAEGGRVEPGRHAGPRGETTELRDLVERGAYAGRHEAPEPAAMHVADGKCVYCWHEGPVKQHHDTRDLVCMDDIACLARGYQGKGPGPDQGAEGPAGDWGPGDDTHPFGPPDYQHPDGDSR